MYKIYINETLLILCSSSELEMKLKRLDYDILVKYTGKPKFLLNYVDFAEKSPYCRVIIIHSSDYTTLKGNFKSLFNIQTAAGGLVINKTGKALIIFRRGFWDLPKGKIEPSEKRKEAALREVKEETGVKNLMIIRKLGKTFHTYRNHLKKRILKRTDWYLMEANQKMLYPQKKEGIEIAEWKKIRPFLDSKPLIYHNIKALLEDYYQT